MIELTPRAYPQRPGVQPIAMIPVPGGVMRYYFDVLDGGGWLRDEQGMTCDTFEQLRELAKRTLTRIAEEEPYPLDEMTLSLNVRDEDGTEVYMVWLEIKGKRH